MRLRRTILCTAIILLSVGALAQKAINPYDFLLPKAQSVIVNEGESFCVDKNTVIYSTNEFLGNYLKEKISNVTDFDIKVEVAKKYPKKAENFIFIGSDKKDLKAANLKDKPEGYVLNVSTNRILISGVDYGGMFNGIQTLLQLMPAEVYNVENKNFAKTIEVKSGKVTDWPKYEYRGFELDVARTFRPVNDVIRLLDWMSYNKLNKFHWHLTDDEGWRIYLDCYPDLATRGGFRGPGEVIPSVWSSGANRYGGYYTKEEMKAVIKYAAERNIEVIPEIETPGHSEAFAMCHPEALCASVESDTLKYTSTFSKHIWCVSKESNYEILDKIIGEMAEIFPSKVINIGGDEVNHTNWKLCPDCQALKKEKGYKSEHDLHNYFVRRLDKIASKYGKTIAGWEELMLAGELHPETLVYVWHSTKPAQTAVTGHHYCVLQVGEYAYFDMQQSPIERGHNWAGIVPIEKTYSLVPESFATPKDNGRTAEENAADVKKYVRGLQAGLWEELGIRPDNFVEYQAFPRLCALAEVAWGTSGGTLNTPADFKDFERRLTQAHYERMSNMQIRYRVPYPKVTATVLDESSNQYHLVAEAPYPGAVVKYAYVDPTANYDGLKGAADTIKYYMTYDGRMTVNDISRYRFATFASDTLHSISVAASNMPLYKQLKPKFTVVSSLPYNGKSKAEDLTDYDPKTLVYFKGRGAAGDYIKIDFSEPVQCSVIDMKFGRQVIDFNGIQNGYVEFSYDGENFIKAEDINCDRAVVRPDSTKGVKSVRVVITGETDSNRIGLCDLLIY